MKISSLLLALLISSFGLQAQSADLFVLGAAGESGTISYTIGETFILTLESGGVDLTHGFHQVYDEPVFVEETEEMDDGFDIGLYPNPSHDWIQLKGNKLEDNTHIQLFDARGKLVLDGRFMKDERIIVRGLARGCYTTRIQVPGNHDVHIIPLIKM
jgi:hypothetical protein